MPFVSATTLSPTESPADAPTSEFAADTADAAAEFEHAHDVLAAKSRVDLGADVPDALVQVREAAPAVRLLAPVARFPRCQRPGAGSVGHRRHCPLC